ncbi:MAG: hypothetical protein M3131_00125, partial [Actinomycetota bacterium]|nr:hypothetical protein [Actinomycetota bacterium]
MRAARGKPRSTRSRAISTPQDGCSSGAFRCQRAYWRSKLRAAGSTAGASNAHPLDAPGVAQRCMVFPPTVPSELSEACAPALRSS